MWHDAAYNHRQRRQRNRDDVLDDLLQEHAESNAAERKQLNRKIWRRRRYLRRREAADKLRESALRGRAPPNKPHNVCINWLALFGQADPATKVGDFYEDIYSLAESEAPHEELARTHFIVLHMSTRRQLTP